MKMRKIKSSFNAKSLLKIVNHILKYSLYIKKQNVMKFEALQHYYTSPPPMKQLRSSIFLRGQGATHSLMSFIQAIGKGEFC